MNRTRRITIGLAALTLALTTTPGVGRAQSDGAEAHVQRGVAHRREGRDADALAEFRTAWELSGSARARAQMGLAEQALQHWVEAERCLDDALATAGDPWIETYRTALEGARATIALHLGGLEVRGGVAGAEVRIDGRAAGTLPIARPLRVTAGSVALEVLAPGYLPLARTVVVTAGGTTHETVDLVARPPVPAPVPRVSAQVRLPQRAANTRRVQSTTPRTLGWVALGGAAVMGGAGVAAMLVARAAEDRYNTNPECTDRYVLGAWTTRSTFCSRDRSVALTAEALGVTALVTAGALGVTSLVLLLTAPRGGRGGTSAARFGCGRGPGDLGVACGGSF